MHLACAYVHRRRRQSYKYYNVCARKVVGGVRTCVAAGGDVHDRGGHGGGRGVGGGVVVLVLGRAVVAEGCADLGGCMHARCLAGSCMHAAGRPDISECPGANFQNMPETIKVPKTERAFWGCKFLYYLFQVYCQSTLYK